MKVWSGSAWVNHPLKRWDGSAWVYATLKEWNGGAWVIIDTAITADDILTEDGLLLTAEDGTPLTVEPPQYLDTEDGLIITDETGADLILG